MSQNDKSPAKAIAESVHVPGKELTKRSAYVLVGAFCAFFCSVGFFNAWGIFQEYYQVHQLSTKSQFDISWIGSFSICAMYLTSPVAGIAYDKMGPRILLSIGSIGALFAIFMVSLCEEYYQFFLAQALVFGVSSAFLLVPSLSTLTKYFKKNRALGMGIVVAGSSTGGVIWPIILDQFLNHTTLGFGWTIRIVAFIMLPLLAISCLLVRVPVLAKLQQNEKDTAPAVKSKADLSIVKSPAFLLCCAGLAIANLGMFSPFFYVSSYAAFLHMSTSFTFYLVSIVNGASFFGRILPGILADRYGCFNLLFCAALTSGIVAFCWTGATSVAGVMVWALAYGFASGAIMSLQTACISRLATPETMGTAMGMAMGSIALMALFGTPISGQLVGQHGYLALSMFAGATLVVGSALIACARLVQDKRLFAVV
ncbi:MFS monocarboxylate transporter [Aureobasidium pullulans]|uniref:MFS monocarboxylate transporter n=1 Tax=Aureobasidium pullulans TaxID=5580 RepID=A0A4S9KWJ1_AURPU|nr:MFS monocarboxylate transporter [Aureobasidium pullulans]